MSAQEVDIEALIRGRSPRRRWALPAALIAAALIAVLAWLLLRGGEAVVIAEPQRVQTASGQLTTTADLSGSAAAANSAVLNFAAAGTVDSIDVQVGDAAAAGAVLARLDDSATQRRLETAQVQLRLAQLRLDELLADPEAAEIAAAARSIAAAEAQVVSAELALQRLSEPPEASAVVSAEQAVSNANSQLSNAQQTLADLTADAPAAELAAAQQAVASARSQLSAADQALAALQEGPSEAEIAGAEQAVANARSQLAGAQQTLNTLTDGPSASDLASARSSVAQAQAQLSSTAVQTPAAVRTIESAHERYCRLEGAVDDICDAEVPLSSAQLQTVETESEDRYTVLVSAADALIDAHASHEAAIAAENSAEAALEAAEARLEELLAPADEDQLLQAQQAVAAAESSRTAADARLDELMTPATADDLFEADQAQAAAQANLDAAVARLDDLTGGAGEADIYQAQQAVAAAAANRGAALARQKELLAPPTEDDIRQAEASLASARLGLEEARARYDALLDGSASTAIEQQQQNVRLAEISLEEAQAALDDLLITAPFDGVIEELNIELGDRVAGASAAIVLSTRNQVVIDLTVTEAELLELESGQVGLAVFDAIDDLQYAVRITAVGRVPEVQQGVVTYSVEAAVLRPEELPAAANQLAAIGGQGAVTIGAEGATGAGGGISPQARAALDAFAAQVTLPPGVEIIDVVRALAFDEPLPEGVVLPDGFEIPEQFKARLRQGFEAADRRAAEREADGGAGQPIPAPGMSASVTILTEVRAEAVLVAASAVRQIDGQFFVAVPADAGGWERMPVEIGETDGANVEILSGLEAGATVLIGADTDGIAFSAAQLASGPAAGGLPGGPGGGGPRGGG